MSFSYPPPLPPDFESEETMRKYQDEMWEAWNRRQDQWAVMWGVALLLAIAFMALIAWAWMRPTP